MARDGSGQRGASRMNGTRKGDRDAPFEANGHDSSETPDLPAFDDALGQLEETVQALESGQLKLDEALAIFERGMHLAHVCQDVLDRAELRVRQLVVADDGSGELALEMREIDVE